MAISFVGVGALSSGTSSPLTPALPGGVQEGDLIVIFAVQDVNGASSVTSDGFTEAAQHVNTQPTPDTNLHVLYKFAGASESNPSVVFDSPVNGVFAFVAAFRGVDTSTPLDGVTPAESTTINSQTFTATGITTATNNAWAVKIAASHGNHTLALTSGSEQGFTDRASGTGYQSATGSATAMILATKAISSAGAVTMPTVQTGGTLVHWTGITFSLREATVSQNATVSASTVSAAAAQPAASLVTNSIVSASVVSAVASIVEMGAETSVTVEPDAVAATASIEFTPTADASPGPSTVAVSAVLAATVTAEGTTFSGPTDERPFAGALYQWDWERGRTVYRKDGTWYEVTDPLWSVIRDADIVAAADRPGGERTDGTDRDRYLFLGGRVYSISETVGTTLTDAGYGEYVEEA